MRRVLVAFALGFGAVIGTACTSFSSSSTPDTPPATDAAADVPAPPPAPAPAPPGVADAGADATVFAEDFASGCDAWRAQDANWTLTPVTGHAGAGCRACNNQVGSDFVIRDVSLTPASGTYTLTMFIENVSLKATDVEVGLKVTESGATDPPLGSKSETYTPSTTSWTPATVATKAATAAGFAQPSIDVIGPGCLDFSDVRIVLGP